MGKQKEKIFHMLFLKSKKQVKPMAKLMSMFKCRVNCNVKKV